MKKFFAACLILILSSAPSAVSQTASPSAQAFVFTHANVIDGVSKEPIRDAMVVVRDRLVESVGSAKTTVPTGATVLDLQGRWLLPGYVDAHAHVPDMAAARRALISGTTTLRDLGVNHFADVGMRDLNHAGVVDVPDFVAAGYHVRPHPAEEFFMDFPKLFDLLPGLQGPEDVRRMVR
jgi:imidazolonepropionase-like amidohydrolase